MKVKELRDTIKQYNVDDLNKIVVELYKRIPKQVKEDYEIDDFIINVKEEKKIVKEEKKIDFQEFVKEINYFLQCARMGLYASPNKIISKKERPKWRFKVKKYYKELINVDVNTQKGKIATDLLLQLYSILSIGTTSLRFSNWDTFRSIQISQTEFLRTVLDRKMQEEVTKEDIKKCINILTLGVDSDTLTDSLFYIYSDSLNNDKQRLMSIEVLKENIVELQDKLKTKEVKNSWNKQYHIEKDINNFTTLILFLYININQVDDAIKFYYKNYIEDSKEVLMYCLLEYLEEFELYEEWVREYEKNKVDYRDSINKKYIAIKKKLR